MNILKLKRGQDKRIRSGHPWVFSNELSEVPRLAPGTIADLLADNGKNYGKVMYNPHSLVSARLLFTHKPIDVDFFASRISAAADYRWKLGFDMSAKGQCRLVFGESDYLPGLVIDKYGNYFAIQLIAAGMEALKDIITEALVRVFPTARGICSKYSTLRTLEGLPESEEILYGKIPELMESEEHGIRLGIDLVTGQKTGYYMDQLNNRAELRKYSKDKKVLDCYTNQGGFALNAAMAGASDVLGIDSSQQAVDRATDNAKLNSLTNVRFEKADVPAFLQSEIASGAKWDIIILDPPAFAKSKKQASKAKAAYAKINRLALQLLSSDGLLVSSSCSQHMPENDLFVTISREAGKQGLSLRQVYRGSQSPDHPVLTAMPETAYLKFFIFNVSRIEEAE